MCVEGGIFFKINKRDSTFIREMRVCVSISIWTFLVRCAITDETIIHLRNMTLYAA